MLADRFAKWLFYIATGAAMITFVAWWLAGSVDDSVVRTVTVLVIACPHALGLAIPLVIVDRAIVAGRTEVWATLVADPRSRLVGATVVGPAAGEVIGELAGMVARRAQLTELYGTVHPYPTYGLAAVDAVGKHLRCRWRK